MCARVWTYHAHSAIHSCQSIHVDAGVDGSPLIRIWVRTSILFCGFTKLSRHSDLIYNTGLSTLLLLIILFGFIFTSLSSLCDFRLYFFYSSSFILFLFSNQPCLWDHCVWTYSEPQEKNGTQSYWQWNCYLRRHMVIVQIFNFVHI